MLNTTHTGITLKQYIKFTLLTSPLFFIGTLLFNYVGVQYTLADIRDQHARDIAISLGTAKRLISSHTLTSNTQENDYKNILMTIAKDFSRVPGVGCVAISIDQINVQAPPKQFCDNIKIIDTVSEDILGNGTITFSLNDKYLSHIELRTRKLSLYLNLTLLTIFILVNYAGFHLTYRQQISYLFRKNRNFFKQNPIPIVQLSSSGLIIDTSPAWDEIFGRKGPDIFEYFTVTDKPEFKQIFDGMIKNETSVIKTLSIISESETVFKCIAKFAFSKIESEKEIYLTVIEFTSSQATVSAAEQEAIMGLDFK